jgi:hypothetical protein
MTSRPITVWIGLLVLISTAVAAGEESVAWLEVEQFDGTGGWSNDSQHVDIMGSPYLLATGVGKPVDDAVTTTAIPETGTYRLWVRCRDWLPEHSPGQFQVIVGQEPSSVTFGKSDSDAWQWTDGGTFELESGDVEIRLHDLTGWWGRCDAIVLALDGFKPADEFTELGRQRIAYCGVNPDVKAMGDYDVVVVGGGPAGIGAALAAARHGCRVALIQDRPVLGGNSSSEIEVPPMGYIGRPPDRVNVTGIAAEIFPQQGWSNFADSHKILQIVRAERNISLFLNTRATGVEMASKNTIKSVLALDVHTGRRMSFTAPRFIDCTGHGWIGYYAGAEYRMGQEARAEFGETLAPVKAGKRTMGNSLYKAVFRDHRHDQRYPPMPGSVVRYNERGKVKFVGDWTHSTFMGGDYIHDDDTGKGAKQISFLLSAETAGKYEVFLGFLAYGNRASHVPVTVTHAEGETSVAVDQRSNTRGWKKLGTFRLTPDESGSVTVSNNGTTGYVVAESVRFVAEGTKAPPMAPLDPEGVPFDCPPWAYQWHKSSDFEGLGTHRRTGAIVRPDNFDRPSRGNGRNPGNDINGAISHAWWVEYGGMLNTVKDAEKIRDELFRISIGLWNYAKNHNPHTVERNKYRELVWLNYVPGVRESRRLVGDYIMHQRDYDEQIVHADTVAFTDWGPDVHHPEGFWVRGNDCIHVYQGRRTSIPYRTLYSKNIENLFMAGRCHSATHIALGGTRVMRPMCATGQAAGTAAAIANEHSTTPRGVYQTHIALLQQTLLKDGCYLLGIRNTDEKDLALTATATASSETAETPAAKVNNGLSRIVGRDRNAWAPNPKASGPPWVHLQLAKAAEVDTVHVTFERQCAACQVQVFVGDQWQTVSDIEDNITRRIVRQFPPVKTDKLRLVFDEPGPNTAVCEWRVYGR